MWIEPLGALHLGMVLPHGLKGDPGRLSARAAALHPLAGSEPPTHAPEGTRSRVGG